MADKIVSAEAAIVIVDDDDVLATTGYGGNGVPEYLIASLERRFLETGGPKNLTLVHSTGQGNTEGKGLDRFAHEGFLKRLIGGYYGL